VDAARARPLTEPERAALARFLASTTHVVVNDRIKGLAASIVEGETNPVRAARRIYDWTFKNIDYWVKDPDHLKASPVGSTEYCMLTKTGNCTDFHRSSLHWRWPSACDAHGVRLAAQADPERDRGRWQLSLLDPVLRASDRLVPLDASLANNLRQGVSAYGEEQETRRANHGHRDKGTDRARWTTTSATSMSAACVVDRSDSDDAAATRVRTGQRARQGARRSRWQAALRLDARVHLQRDRPLTRLS